MKHARDARRSGQSLVEFALVALVLYLLLAATVDLGRATFSVQVVEDAARVAARELALMPFPAAGPNASTTAAIGSDAFRERVFDRNWLVIDLDQDADGDGVSNEDELNELFGQLPVVNQQLRPLYVFEQFDQSPAPPLRLLRYPGALLQDNVDLPIFGPQGPTTPISELTVRIPLIRYEASPDREAIYAWVDVLEPAGGASDPFPLAPGDPRQGLAALRVNYPFQAATLGNFREETPDRFDPNIADAVVADDGAVTTDPSLADAPAAGDFFAPDAGGVDPSPVAGRYGLGRQLALGQELRPFRRVQTAQAVFRRELFGPGP
jgi:hypothetical protein